MGNVQVIPELFWLTAEFYHQKIDGRKTYLYSIINKDEGERFLVICKEKVQEVLISLKTLPPIIGNKIVELCITECRTFDDFNSAFAAHLDLEFTK